MANGEKFCFRWNEFENNISTAFRELRDDKDFFDVTLACDDNQLQAHKVILSACSPFFRSILKKNPHQHPLLYLKGVKYEDVLSVLNFMYHGEVNVAQDDLNTFLSVAEDLQVKGLTQTSQKQQQASQNIPATKRSLPEQSPSNILPMIAKPPKQPRVRTSYEHAMTSGSYARKIEEISPIIKTEAPVVDVECDPEYSSDQQLVQQSNDFPADEPGYEYQHDQHNYQDQDMVYEEQIGHGGDTSQGWNLPKQFPCQHCEKSFSSKKSLQNHMTSHKGLTYCDICNKHFSTVSNLKAHTNLVHPETPGTLSSF
eukprot:GFUD01020571.1.p1 GENE.GFUD01020571.1~~GFUD01020571.1.p1  ORF type:complete len:312 (-),score=57.37 GFUD01020571.1:288-1223(-)